MKTIFNLFVLAILLSGNPGRCLAARSIGILSASEAKEIGVEIRTTPSGPEAVWLELEFKTAGRLKDYNPAYSHVEMEIRDGEKSLVSFVALQSNTRNLGTSVSGSWRTGPIWTNSF